MNECVLIKPITVEDVAELKTVALHAYRDHYLHLWHDSGEWYIERSFSLNQLFRELSDGNARFYLIYFGGTWAGFLKLNINAPLSSRPNIPALELERIYLTQAASGRGVGTALLRFVFETTKELNKELVWLKVMDSSAAAIAFYRNMALPFAVPIIWILIK